MVATAEQAQLFGTRNINIQSDAQIDRKAQRLHREAMVATPEEAHRWHNHPAMPLVATAEQAQRVEP